MSFISLKTKLLSSFVFVGILAVLIGGALSYSRAKSALEKTSFNALTVSREIKRRQIEAYFTRIRSQVLTMSQDQVIIEALNSFTNHQGAQTFHNTRGPFIRNFLTRFGYRNIFLADTSAMILYSGHADPEFPANGIKGVFRKTGLARVFHDAVTAESPLTKLSDFEFYPPGGTATAFIAAPVFDAGRKTGVLILQLAPDEINRVMTGDRNWEAEGFGKTGETYLVGSDLTMRSDSRFLVEEPIAFFKQVEKQGTPHEVVLKMKQKGSTILFQKVKTLASQSAMTGITDTKVLDDYRGVRVLSSYTPLKIPDVNWVIVSEIDVAEAFQSVFDLRDSLILMALLLSLTVAILGTVLSRAISRPIDLLSLASKRLGEGDMKVRIHLKARDEFGLLGNSFNQMAENLEHEIEERQLLEKRILEISEEEQRRIGQDLHDGLAQELLGMSFLCRSLQKKLAAQGIPDAMEFDKLTSLLDKSVNTAREFAAGLCPVAVESDGIVFALRELASNVTHLYGIKCEFQGADLITIPDRVVAHNLYRIIQESVVNAAKHGRATRIDISLEPVRKSGFRATISDNGIGIGSPAKHGTEARKGLGLKIMEIRARSVGATLGIERGNDRGTVVTCTYGGTGLG